MYKSYSALNRLCRPITPAKTSNEKFLPQNDQAYFNPQYGYPNILTIKQNNTPIHKTHEPIMIPEEIKAYGKKEERESYCTSCRSGDDNCPDCKSTICTCDNRLDPLMDPRYNLREVAKQLILLQDHLAFKKKRCQDCISKHVLGIEALLEEAVTLDNNAEYTELITDALKTFKKCMKPVLQQIAKKQLSNDVCHQASQTLRQLRKPLCMNYVGFC